MPKKDTGKGADLFSLASSDTDDVSAVLLGEAGEADATADQLAATAGFPLGTAHRCGVAVERKV